MTIIYLIALSALYKGLNAVLKWYLIKKSVANFSKENVKKNRGIWLRMMLFSKVLLSVAGFMLTGAWWASILLIVIFVVLDRIE